MERVGFALAAPLPVKDLIAIAKEAENKGYESFWLTEGGARDSISQLGAVAVNTSRIKLGAGIINIFSRTPALMALTASAMSELSEGRFILGLGAGHQAAIENNHGVQFRRPVARMGDYVRIIKTALRERQVSYYGEVCSAPNFQILTPRREPDPAVYIATLGENMGRLAGAVADGVLPLLATPQGIEEVVDNVQEGAQAVGRNPEDIDIACYIISCASPDAAADEAEARRMVARYGSMPFYQNMLRRSGHAKDTDAMIKAWAAGDGAAAARAISDALLSDVTLVGKPEKWQQTINKFRVAGVTQPIVYVAPVGSAPTESVRQALAAGAPG